MPDALLLVLMAAFGAALILVLGLVLFRAVGDRAAAMPPVPAAFRKDAGEVWRRGTLRIDHDRLVLKGPGGLAVGPWVRGNLDLGVASPVLAEEAQALGHEHLIRVPGTYGTATFELALGEEHYTALRAWVEAVPPGWNSQVA